MRDKRPIGIQAAFHAGFALALLALGILVIGLFWSAQRRGALRDAQLRSELILNYNLAIHTYFTRELKPNLFRYPAISDDPDYFDPSWMSSSYAVRSIQGILGQLDRWDYYYKECSVNARHPHSEADEFERAFLDEVNLDPRLVFRSGVREIGGQPWFYVMRRGEVAEDACVRCHSDPALAPRQMLVRYGTERGFTYAGQLGQVVSAVSVRLPLAEAYGQANRQAGLMAVVLGILFSLFYVVHYLFTSRVLFAPIRAIRDRMAQIAGGELGLGQKVDMPKGRELADLAVAFNRMSDKVAEERALLEERVADRTADLKTLASRLEQALADKEVLFKEVHHRIKNNLHLISGLLDRQAAVLEGSAVTALQDCRRRVMAIADLHEHLYRSEEKAVVHLDRYISGLAGSLARSCQGDRRGIDLELDLAPVDIGMEPAVACGLVISELVMNAFKHAFPAGRGGRITIRLERQDGGFNLEVADDGVGMERIGPSGGFGLGLVPALVEQMGGTMKVLSATGKGTRYEIRVVNLEGKS